MWVGDVAERGAVDSESATGEAGGAQVTEDVVVLDLVGWMSVHGVDVLASY
jgi:hypothetical protein